MAAELLIQALEHTRAVLEPRHVPYAVMGGFALAAWNQPRSTLDLDLLIAIPETELPGLLESLQASGLKPKRDPPVIEVGEQRFAQFLYTAPGTFVDVQVDFLLAVTAFQHSAMCRRVVMDLPNHTRTHVVAVEDLILFKLIAGRIIDLVDAARLLRANRHELDAAYLQSWVDRLSLRTVFEEVWTQAFPPA